MGTDPVVRKWAASEPGHQRWLHVWQRHGSRLCQSIESITKGAVDPLDVDSAGFGNDLTQDSTDLDGEQFPTSIPMFDRRRQAHVCRNQQWGTSQLPRAYCLTIGTSEDRRIARALHRCTSSRDGLVCARRRGSLLARQGRSLCARWHRQR